jgi:hypothetical protein
MPNLNFELFIVMHRPRRDYYELRALARLIQQRRQRHSQGDSSSFDYSIDMNEEHWLGIPNHVLHMRLTMAAFNQTWLKVQQDWAAGLNTTVCQELRRAGCSGLIPPP